MSNRIIVTGGAGYIGSQVTLDLKEAGFEPVVIDNYSNSSRDLAQQLGVEVQEGDIADGSFLRKVFNQVKPAAVMHFAAFAYVGESVENPLRYYRNNVAGSISLLEAMIDCNVKNLIFSSTCATYGTPAIVPITEETPLSPINPYGNTKLVMENIIQDCQSAHQLNTITFRYFNAAGAHHSGTIGEAHFPESHIIPLAIYAAMGGKEFTVFGDDYDTPDGTCIRDYIHIADISQAHILGLQRLLKERYSGTFNIGTGHGNSVLEVLKTIEKVSGKIVPYKLAARRPGDPPRLVAEAKLLTRELAWKPRYPSLEEIVTSAWNWHSGKGLKYTQRCI